MTCLLIDFDQSPYRTNLHRWIGPRCPQSRLALSQPLDILRASGFNPSLNSVAQNAKLPRRDGMKRDEIVLIDQILRSHIICSQTIAKPKEQRPNRDIYLTHGQGLTETCSASARKGGQELFSVPHKACVSAPSLWVERVGVRKCLGIAVH